MKAKVHKSPLMAAIHETAEDLYTAGTMPKRTLHDFDELCLTPVHPTNAVDIRSLTQREGISQAVFAKHLNITTGLVSPWERGEKKPAGASLKLLTLVK